MAPVQVVLPYLHKSDSTVGPRSPATTAAISAQLSLLRVRFEADSYHRPTQSTYRRIAIRGVQSMVGIQRALLYWVGASFVLLPCMHERSREASQMKETGAPIGQPGNDGIAWLEQRLARERRIRDEAETMADELYKSMHTLEDRNRNLESANRVSREFVTIAAHDLRGPLSAILGFAAILRDSWATLTDERRLEFIEIIHSQGAHLDRLVTDLLTVSSLDSGIVNARLEDVRIADVLREIIRGIGPEAAEIVLSVRDGDTRALVDVHHLDRMLRNLVSNAAKYGRPPIEISCEVSGGWVELRVVDHGDGVPPDFLQQLFEKFARAEDPKVRGIDGTGLGLSIVRGLARLNGGEAFYEPYPTGACFGVRLRNPG